MHVFVAVKLALIAGASLVVVFLAVNRDLSILWARTTPPFVGDYAVAKPLGITAESTGEMTTRLDAFDLARIGKGETPVPAIYFARMPEDIADHGDVEDQKRLFIQVALPLILKVNDTILALRARLETVADRHAAEEDVDAEDAAFVRRLAEWYDTDEDDLDVLLRRVDIVPPSLALAQAVEESGWGRSRFARVANALFGQHAFTVDRPTVAHPVDGVAPMRAFPDLISSVSTYVHNLNTHPAYKAFRAERARQRKAGEGFDTRALAATLTRYSERGEAYVESIQDHIRVGSFERYDTASLAR